MPRFIKKYARGRSDFLEVDEILFDQHQLALKDLKWENRLEKNIALKNIKIFGYILITAAAFIFLRYAGLVFNSGEYIARARSNYIKEIWDLSPRGIIYDSNQKPLVKNISSFNLVVIPAELPRAKGDQKKVVSLLAGILNQDEPAIEDQFRNIDIFSFRPVLVLEDLNHEELLMFKSQLDNLPGFRLEENFKREYLGGGAFNHILGYTGRVSSGDVKIKPDYLLTDIIGKSGLELEYENFLRGQHGVTLVEGYARGGTGRIVGTHESISGKNLNLFLNIPLQEKLTEVMGRALSGAGLSRAAAVAINPKSGGILALQSFPMFDGNVFGSRLSPEAFKNIFENKDQPLFNRALGGLYPPGSTVKPFLGVAALQEKIVDDKTTINDRGFITVGSQEFKGWSVLGVVDIYRAIALSSNIFFYTIGGGYGNIAGLGPIKIADYLSRFGFSKLTQIDLPGEAKGFLPSPDWKRATKHEGWFVGDTYNMSIGQGFVQVTPLQLTLATAAIANNGTLFKPRVVKSITDSNNLIIKNIEPEVLSKNFVDSESLAIIRKAMRETAVSGSARSLANLPGGAGAKTGTAQTGVGNNTHAWFTVFAPYENPEIALTVLVENGGEGSSMAVPIAREVLEWYLAR
ncbi:MAG: penicillin-binding protein 2 [Parcubacteria group bacterium]|nr:penicillin-binding protein 2 [Parcubacteria group bacterium]